MTQEDALEVVDRMVAVRRAETVVLARECGLSEGKIFLLLEREPCLPPASITLKKFAQPIDPAAIRRIEGDLEVIDPELMKEIVDKAIQRLRVSPRVLGMDKARDGA